MVSKSALGASPAVYIGHIPLDNKDEQNPPPRQSTQNRNKSKHVDSTNEDIHLLGQLYMTILCMSGKGMATACLKSRMPIVHRPYPD